MLDRHKVKPINSLIKMNINKQNILVTGGAGSIGSQICREIEDETKKNSLPR